MRFEVMPWGESVRMATLARQFAETTFFSFHLTVSAKFPLYIGTLSYASTNDSTVVLY